MKITGDELEDLGHEIINNLLEVLNAKLIRPHVAGAMEGSDAIHIAVVALTRVVAITLASQIPDKAVSNRLLEHFIELLKADVLEVQGWEKKEGDTNDLRSAWDVN